MGLKAKTFQFLNRYLPILTGSSGVQKDIYLYGYNNLLPNDNLRIINDSGIAKRAAEKLKRYIEADGFVDEKSAKLKVNPEQTADELLMEVSSYAACFGGVAFTVQRDAGGKIVALRKIDFQCVRVRKDGNYIYNPLFGQKDFKDTDTKVHPKYFGVESTPDQRALIASPRINGKVNEFYNNLEILYVFDKTADNPIYPVPTYIAGIEDLKTSAELQGMDLESVRNSFMPSSILVTHEMDDETKDATGKTESDYMEDALKKFTGGVKDREGVSKRLSLMWIQVKSMEETPDLKTFDAKGIIEGTISKRDQVERTVARWFGVHPVLLGFSDAAVLGNTQAIANASKDLADHVNPVQRMISRAFGMVFPNFDWTISEFKYWSNIPSEVWSVLTEDEKRAVGGYAPVEKDIPTESERTITAINSLSPLVANKVLESMTIDEIRGLVGLGKTDTNEPDIQE